MILRNILFTEAEKLAEEAPYMVTADVSRPLGVQPFQIRSGAQGKRARELISKPLTISLILALFGMLLKRLFGRLFSFFLGKQRSWRASTSALVRVVE